MYLISQSSTLWMHLGTSFQSIDLLHIFDPPLSNLDISSINIARITMCFKCVSSAKGVGVFDLGPIIM